MEVSSSQNKQTLWKPLHIDEGLLLVTIAKQTVEETVCGKHSIPPDVNTLPQAFPPDVNTLPQALKEHGSCYVSVYINEDLRGCMGSFCAWQPLGIDVADSAIQAVTEDNRFPPIKPYELQYMRVIVSVLSLPERIFVREPQALLSSFEEGRHGMIISTAFGHIALLLPLAWEQYRSKESFFEAICTKANLPANAWYTKDVAVYRFETQIFSDAQD
jgi:AmmeMemoRadiSam system protein A